MLKIEFALPLTALGIREPVIAECENVADSFGIYAKFQQPQQQAFGSIALGGTKRERTGNGKHKSWYIDYQSNHPSSAKPHIVGSIILASPRIPKEMQFGGFDYGKYGEPSPVYNFITVHTPSELNYFRAIDPSPEMLEMTYAGLVARFDNFAPRIF